MLLGDEEEEDEVESTPTGSGNTGNRNTGNRNSGNGNNGNGGRRRKKPAVVVEEPEYECEPRSETYRTADPVQCDK